MNYAMMTLGSEKEPAYYRIEKLTSKNWKMWSLHMEVRLLKLNYWDRSKETKAKLDFQKS
jgi:hypothetical protein